MLNSVQAGFPSPAEDHASERVDLNKILIKHPLATYLMRVRGASMREAGIDDGDVVLVDRAVKPCHGHVVVAVVDGVVRPTPEISLPPFKNILKTQGSQRDVSRMVFESFTHPCCRWYRINSQSSCSQTTVFDASKHN